MAYTSTGVRTRYHIALNGKGFMLRGAPQRPAYIKAEAVSVISTFRVQNEADITNIPNNSFTGSGWDSWTQTDWSGGFQVLQYADDASFKDGQAIDVTTKYGKASLQYGWTSAVALTSGSHSYGAHDTNGTDLIFGTIKAGAAKVFKVTSGFSSSTLSAYTGISAVNSVTRFNNNSILGLTRTSGTLKTMSLYKSGTSILSGFRSVNPIVRSVKGIGIRLYSGERVASLSGDVLYYATNLSAFTSAYQVGKNRNIAKIEDLNGSPYFFVVEGRQVDLFQWDEVAQRAYPIYSWDDLTAFSVKKYLTLLVISGYSANQHIAWAFNGARIWQIFDDQLLDPTYDFRHPFEFEGDFHLGGTFWDGEYFFPGLYGKVGTKLVAPFENFANKAIGFISGATLQLAYQDRAKYAISGFAMSSEFGSQIAGVDKLLNAVDMNFDALAAGQTIDLQYSINGGTNFTSLGTASFTQDGAVTKKRMYFPSGYVAKLWLVKPVLIGPGTSSPSLNDVTVEYRPFPDLKKTWTLTVDAADDVLLLNRQREQRDGKALVEDMWLQKEQKQSMVYEDVNAFSVAIVSAISKTATSARVSNTKGMPPRGRVRVLQNNVIEEMTYTSADGGSIKGIIRGRKGTLARAYTSADRMDNNYAVVITNLSEQLTGTDDIKTESIARVTLLEV